MNSNLIDALHLALDMEEQSYTYYLRAAQRSHNSVVEAVLRSLAEDENSHINIIRRFYAALEKTRDWPNVDFQTFDTSSAHDRFEKIISMSEIELVPDTSYAEVYEFARDKELHARDFYKEQQEINKSDPDLFKFFGFLANMENVHMKMLDLLVQGTKAAMENKPRQNK